MQKILKAIEDGTITIKWKYWVFGGGRDYGDWTTYELNKDGKLYGFIEDNLRNGITVTIGDKIVFQDVEDETIVNRTREILQMALKRDDPEFIEHLPVDESGEFIIPDGYEDIDRAEVMSGEWKNYFEQ